MKRYPLAWPLLAGLASLVANAFAEESALPSFEALRLIEGTTSPDGRFAFGWADEKMLGQDAATSLAGKLPKLQEGERRVAFNFLVRLDAKRTLALSSGQHYGDAAQLNHKRCSVAWSKDSKWCFEIQSWKWHSDVGTLWRLEESKETGLRVRSLDILGGIHEPVFGCLAEARHRSIQRFPKSKFALTIASAEVDSQGNFKLSITGEVPKEESADAHFEVVYRATATTNREGPLRLARPVVGEK